MKRGHAINGDLFELRGESDVDVPFTTFIDVAFRGTTHQVFAAADRQAFSYATTTGEFTVGEFQGHILETLDSVETQVAHRYQALVTTPSGVLSVHSYESVPHLLSLVGALRPTETRLGLTVNPDDEVEYTSAPKVALSVDIGVLEITPLTTEVIGQLPDWQGTAVDAGELYGGRFTDDAVYLTLVTPTCRVLALPGPDINEDTVAATMSGFHATWQA